MTTDRVQPTIPTVFVSYAREDEDLREELGKYLAVMQREGLIKLWHDRFIDPGDNFEERIKAALDTSSFVLLLISVDYLNSEYCQQETQWALQRQEAGQTRVIPVILRPCNWQGRPFGKLQVLPKDGEPVRRWHLMDDAFCDIDRGLRRIIRESSRRGHVPDPPPPPPPEGSTRLIRVLSVSCIVILLALPIAVLLTRRGAPTNRDPFESSTKKNLVAPTPPESEPVIELPDTPPPVPGHSEPECVRVAKEAWDAPRSQASEKFASLSVHNETGQPLNIWRLPHTCAGSSAPSNAGEVVLTGVKNWRMFPVRAGQDLAWDGDGLVLPGYHFLAVNDSEKRDPPVPFRWVWLDPGKSYEFRVTPEFFTKRGKPDAFPGMDFLKIR
jgi:hypothetical protein